MRGSQGGRKPASSSLLNLSHASSSLTGQAARCRFGVNANYLQCERINDVFSSVEKGVADFGVAPVENSTEGAISQTLDLLATCELDVVAEVCLDIRHNLLSLAPLDRVRTVYSHPQALAQCRSESPRKPLTPKP